MKSIFRKSIILSIQNCMNTWLLFCRIKVMIAFCILHLDHYQEQDMQYYLDKYKQKKIVGLLTSSPIQISKKSGKLNLPVVSFDRVISPQIPTVQSNNYDAGMQIAKSVLKQKKKKVIIIAGSKEDYYPISDRIKGMMCVCNTFDVKFDLRSISARESIIAS